ncbi:MAG: hypothetical protein KC964_29445, partial [Candidatus Omnitrophica bacterium]|nr:hypothetical protein [Candidatus Omnitrophota bacterium]
MDTSAQNVEVVNTTISENKVLSNFETTGMGGAVYARGSIRVRNAIVWNNLADESPEMTGDGSYTVRDSNIKGGFAGARIIGENPEDDPLFRNPFGLDGVAGTMDDDYRLQLGSPSVDAGRDASVPNDLLTDLDGFRRIVDHTDFPNNGFQGSVVDMGPYELQIDCDDSGVPDYIEIEQDPSLDCNGNELFDICEIAADPSLDCDINGKIDDCELAADPSLDCDLNGILVVCDIASDPTLDCDENGKIDDCELAADPSLDCNLNGIIDICDIAADPSLDCDGNFKIDTCELATDPSLDCNFNGILDYCDTVADPSLDCDGNFKIDTCELATDPSIDCDQNGIIDTCDIAADPSLDCDSNG